MRALLVGKQPPLEYAFVTGEYDAVVIGSLSYAQALGAYPEQMLEALAGGMPVILYEPGFPRAEGNRALGASLASRRRELKNWGVRFVSGREKKLITAQEARRLKEEGQSPAPGAVLTPLAREIFDSL